MAALRGFASFALIGWLSACTAGGPLPQPVDQPVVESDLSASDGSPLGVSRWEADSPEALILALHGYGDHAESTFSDAAAYWAGVGISTIAYDQRGFGRNPSRGYWPGADALIADLTRVAIAVRHRNPCLPLVALGHSMGGGVVLATAPDLEVDGIVLAAPAIWGGDELNPIHRLAAWTAASVTPDRRFTGRGVVRIQASDNIETLKALVRDPLYLRPPSARELLGLVRVTDRAAEASDRVMLPALMLLGKRDQIVPEASVSRVFARTGGRKQTIRYPDGWHLLFRDLKAAKVWDDVAKWVRQLPVPKGCSG